MKMVICDLDGTLLNKQNQVGSEDLHTLEILGQNKIIRVIATGRSYFSFQKVIPADFPIDFVVLSSGAGIMDWVNKKLFFQSKISTALVRKIADLLINYKIDFMVHDELPENHLFHFHHANHYNGDFKKRLDIYTPFAQPVNSTEELNTASQFVLIFPKVEDFHKELRDELTDVSIIRATSPLDKESVWFELMPKGVSKKSAAKQLARKYNFDSEEIFAMGNDYNDQDLLDWVENSYVVSNAPSDLKARYKVTVSNEENPLSACLAE